jgi:hypothetical protein
MRENKMKDGQDSLIEKERKEMLERERGKDEEYSRQKKWKRKKEILERKRERRN